MLRGSISGSTSGSGSTKMPLKNIRGQRQGMGRLQASHKRATKLYFLPEK
jgi:hypothetical protein